jgi:hypothetical protein
MAHGRLGGAVPHPSCYASSGKMMMIKTLLSWNEERKPCFFSFFSPQKQNWDQSDF